MANYDLIYPGQTIDQLLTTAYYLKNAGYIFLGSASSYSGTPSQRAWLIAPSGFTGFGFSEAIPIGSMGICLYNGTSWSGVTINVVTVDENMTAGSVNPISSGAVYDTLSTITQGISAQLDSLELADATDPSDILDVLTVALKMTKGGFDVVVSSLDILSATASKAGLMSAADKIKLDGFLNNIRSMVFADTTPPLDLGTKIVESLKWTVDNVQEVITTLTLLAASTEKAGLMSAADKTYIDGLPTTLGTLTSALQDMMASILSIVFDDTTPSSDKANKIVETMKWTSGGIQRAITTLTILAASSEKAGLMSAADKAYVDGLPATLTSLSNSINSIETDLLNYYTKEQTYSKTEVDTLLDGKQNVIDDLASIRSGSSAGATAVQPADMNSAISSVRASIGYYECSTAAATAAKVVSASGYTLTNGGCIRIKMANANTADNATLNINGTGAKALFYDGAQASSANTWEAGEVLEVYYDGTQYQCASGGGGKFASGEKVKDISITDEITANSNALIESGAVYDVLYAVALDNSLTEGYYLQGTSSERRVADANWGYTDYIPAVNGDTIKSVFGTNVTTANLTCVAYYNASKQILAAWSANGYNNSRDGMTINNANAAYIRANIYLPNKQNCGVYINGTQVWGFGRNTDGIQKQIDNINDEIDDFEETFAVTDDVTENSTSPISSGGVWDAIYGYRENALTQGCMKVNNNVFSIVSSTDWGYTDFIPASNGDIVDSIFGVDARSLTGIVCIAYFDSNKNYLAAWTVGGYNNRRSGMTINNENAAYIRGNIYLSSRENCAIYINGSEVWGYDYQGGGIEPRIGILETDLAEIDEKIDAIEDTLDKVGASNKMYLPLYCLINSDTAGGQISSNSQYDAKRVVTKCATCFPVENMTWKVKLPTNYSLYVWLGNSAANSFTINTDGWITNGSTFETTGKKCYRVVFRKGDGTELLPNTEIQALVDSGDISIYTEMKEESVLVRNIAKDVEVGALRRILITDLAGNGMDTMFVFGHLSDVHGDAPRMKNFLDYCNNQFDVVCVSGDSALYRGSYDYTDYQVELAKSHDSDFLFCIGNHEAYPTGQSNLFAKYMQNLATEYSYLKSSGTVTDVCYWYKDYDAKNIRIIAINYYEGGVYSGCLGQAQITWFINTLASTPAGYGVIVMLHSPEDAITVEPPYDIFKQKHRIWNGQPNGFYVGDRPISHIIDAFISKGTYTGSYTESTSEAVTINADFSQVDVSTEFIAFVVGHLHEDWIGYYSHATNKQLSLGITTGNALYGDSSNPAWSNQSDLPRGGVGTCQDAFNIYAIDRINKYVKIVRIGADITETFVERKMMMIPYKDS